MYWVVVINEYPVVGRRIFFFFDERMLLYRVLLLLLLHLMPDLYTRHCKLIPALRVEQLIVVQKA